MQQSLTTDAAGGALALHDLGVVLFEGTDVTGFLQGYLTTDTGLLGASPQFTAMCNLKGRVVCTGFAWLENSAVSLVLHRSLCSAVLDFLRPYLAFSKVNASQSACAVLGTLNQHPSPPRWNALAGGSLSENRALFVVDESSVDEYLGPAPALERDRWDDDLVGRGEVWLQAQTSGRFLPQMLGLEELGAVSFSKGCYLGQEVVARAQHRGQVKRRLERLNWAGAAPSPGAAVEADGREVGTVLAVAGSGASGKALAVLVRDQAGPFSAPQAGTRLDR